MFKVNNKDAISVVLVFLQLTLTFAKVNFEHILPLVLVLLLTLNMYLPAE